MLPLRFDLIDAPLAPVITSHHPQLAGNKYGFEGGSNTLVEALT